MLATMMPARNESPAFSTQDSDSESELAERQPVARSARPSSKTACEASSVSERRQKADELLQRYHNALDAAGVHAAQSPKGRPELVSEAKADESEEEGEEEGREGEFVYVKKSIQQFLNVRVLSLEKDNYALRSEFEASRKGAAHAALALRLQRLQHGLHVLASMLARRERALLSLAFSQLRAAAAAGRADKAKTAELKELRDLVSQLQAQAQQAAAAPAPPAREPASPRARRHSAPVVALDGGAGDALEMLRAENRRLQIELEDRSRAAELLCKRLLRVDAVARSMSQ